MPDIQIKALQKKLNIATEKEKVEILYKLGDAFLNRNLEMAIDYGRQALELAQTIDDNEAIGQGHQIIGMGLFQAGKFVEALEHYHKSMEIFIKLDRSPKIASININMANIYLMQGKYHRALTLYTKAIDIFQHLDGYHKEIAIALRNIGGIYLRQADYSKSLDYFQNALKKYKQINNLRGIAICLGDIGCVYFNQGNDCLSLDYALKALKMNEQLDIIYAVANNSSHIALIYYRQKNYKKSLDYEFKALQLKEKIGDPNLIATSYYQLGLNYQGLKEFGKSLSYHQKALKIREEVGDKYGITFSLTNIGDVYRSQKKYSLSIEYLKKALELNKEMNNDILTADINICLGLCYLDLNQLDNAEECGLKALEFAEERKGGIQIKESTGVLFRVYEQKKDYKKAFEYHILYQQAIEKLLDEEKIKQITEMQTKYEIKNIEQQNKELATLAKNLTDKNKLLQELHKKISNMDKEDSLSKEELVASILSYLKNINTAEGGWHVFEDQVDKIYPGFISHLCKNYPSLTRQELTVCVLLRLDFTNKKIAQTLYVTTRTIEVYRTRIRKKLKLCHKTPLKLFLSAL